MHAQAPPPTAPLPRRALAAPAALLMTVGQGAFRGLQDMRTPLAITLAANAINLGLDTLLIVFLGWGVKGAAAATTTAEWVAALAYLGVLYGRRDALGGLSPRLVLGSSLRAAADEMAPFLKAGGAMLMRTGLLLGTKTLASATAARWAGRGGAGRAPRAAAGCRAMLVALAAAGGCTPPARACARVTAPSMLLLSLQAGRGPRGGTPGGHPALAAVLPSRGLGCNCGAEPGGGAGAQPWLATIGWRTVGRRFAGVPRCRLPLGGAACCACGRWHRLPLLVPLCC